MPHTISSQSVPGTSMSVSGLKLVYSILTFAVTKIKVNLPLK